MNIIEAIAAAPYVSAAFRATLSGPEQTACDARQLYIDARTALGETYDPVMADETFWRVLRRAQGLSYYSGD